MRPVQRLPSVTLLLNDLLKHTKREKDHCDVVALDKALAKIKEVRESFGFPFYELSNFPVRDMKVYVCKDMFKTHVTVKFIGS
jgi:hypothetical protein